MKKAGLATIWTVTLAVPFTLLGIGTLVFLTDHLPELTQLVQRVGIRPFSLALEFSARWPEVAAMVIGQLVILMVFLATRSRGRPREQTGG
jgi:hypothetical protein